MLTAEQLFYLKEIEYARNERTKLLKPAEKALLVYVCKSKSLSPEVHRKLKKLHERCTELARIKR